MTDTPYRIFFTSVSELNSWLKAREWKPVERGAMDADSVLEWTRKKEYIKLTENIFDDNDKLKIYTEQDWDDSWLRKTPWPEDTTPPDEEDDIPF